MRARVRVCVAWGRGGAGGGGGGGGGGRRILYAPLLRGPWESWKGLWYVHSAGNE